MASAEAWRADGAGRTALVTGASTGIGRATAAELWARDYSIVLVARRERLLEELVAELPAPRGSQQAWILPADVTQEDTADRIAAEVRTRCRGLEVLVNAAGGSRPVQLGSGYDAWLEGMELNFLAVLRLTHAVLPDMLAAGHGRIVNVTGGSEPRGLNAAGPAKAAVHAWAKGLSCVVARRGVTVNSIAPGRVESEQIRRMHPTAADREAFARANIPAGYFGDGADVARVVAFLASPDSRYVTGELIHVDGGMRRYAF